MCVCVCVRSACKNIYEYIRRDAAVFFYVAVYYINICILYHRRRFVRAIWPAYYTDNYSVFSPPLSNVPTTTPAIGLSRTNPLGATPGKPSTTVRTVPLTNGPFTGTEPADSVVRTRVHNTFGMNATTGMPSDVEIVHIRIRLRRSTLPDGPRTLRRRNSTFVRQNARDYFSKPYTDRISC